MVPIDRSERRTRPIPLTPLIDVVFLLMVFFILTTHFVRIEALDLSVSTPDASSQGASSQSYKHELVLLGDGAIFLDQQMVHAGKLEQALEVLFFRDAKAAMTVKCNKEISVQRLIDVLDMIKRSGGGTIEVAHWQQTTPETAQ